MAEKLDITEKGGIRNGERQVSDRRLFMQLLGFGHCHESRALAEALEASGIPSVLYEEVSDIHGVGLLTWSDNADFFVTTLRPFLLQPAFATLTPKLEYSMLGRTYSIGYEPDLNDWLLEKAPRTVTNRAVPWAVWYPLRRTGAFQGLPAEEQSSILAEHGRIGHAFGEAGYAQDVRLACFGLDKNDNDFVIGLIGADLAPLSKCVEMMRKTRQTSQYIHSMGPFFVGKAIWQKHLA
jgi:Chlorite dismutase